MVERLFCKQEVIGSIPLRSTTGSCPIKARHKERDVSISRPTRRYCGVFRRWLPKRAHNPKTSVRVRLPQLNYIVLWSSWLRRQILNLKMVCSSHTGTSKNETMIKTVLHNTGGISLDAFNKLTAYVKKVRPGVTERVGKHVRFSSN